MCVEFTDGSILTFHSRHFGPRIITLLLESTHHFQALLTMNSWRAEEAAFALVPTLVSEEDSEEYTQFLKTVNSILPASKSNSPPPTPTHSRICMLTLTVDPVVAASAISAAFALNKDGYEKSHYVDIMQIMLESESPIIKIKGLVALVNRSAPVSPSFFLNLAFPSLHSSVLDH